MKKMRWCGLIFYMYILTNQIRIISENFINSNVHVYKQHTKQKYLSIIYQCTNEQLLEERCLLGLSTHNDGSNWHAKKTTETSLSLEI